MKAKSNSNTYVKKLEKQNEELQTRLAVFEDKLGLHINCRIQQDEQSHLQKIESLTISLHFKLDKKYKDCVELCNLRNSYGMLKVSCRMHEISPRKINVIDEIMHSPLNSVELSIKTISELLLKELGYEDFPYDLEKIVNVIPHRNVNEDDEPPF